MVIQWFIGETSSASLVLRHHDLVCYCATKLLKHATQKGQAEALSADTVHLADLFISFHPVRNKKWICIDVLKKKRINNDSLIF